MLEWSDPRRFPRYVYVPWVSADEHAARCARVQVLAGRLAGELGVPIVGYAATRRDLPAGWAKRPAITRRSRYSRPVSSVGIHFQPTLLDLAARSPQRSTHAFVMEGPSDDLSGWARHHRAVHIDTALPLSPTISSVAKKLYELIDWNGNLGWRDRLGRSEALHGLIRLRDLGELEPVDLLGYLIDRQPPEALHRLLDVIGDSSSSRWAALERPGGHETPQSTQSG